MEYWNGVTGMDSLEWRILDRVSSRNFIFEGSSRITWEVGSVFGGRGGGGGGGRGLPLRPPPPPPPPLR